MTPVHRELAGPAIVLSLADEVQRVRAQLASSTRSARTLLKEGPLRVVVVGLQPGGATSAHAADGPVTLQVLDGVVELEADGRTWTLAAGAMLALAPRIVHDVRSRDGGIFLLTIAGAERPATEGGVTLTSPHDATHPPPVPTFRELSGEECRALLDRNHVGRLAFSFRDRVDIQPIHYVHDDGWLYGRTSEGEKLLTLEHNRWMAFEVDEVAGPFDWRSVVGQGTFYRLDVDSADPAVAAHAVALLRSIAPSTLSTHDPTPHRTVLFRIALHEVSGREARGERE